MAIVMERSRDCALARAATAGLGRALDIPDRAAACGVRFVLLMPHIIREATPASCAVPHARDARMWESAHPGKAVDALGIPPYIHGMPITSQEQDEQGGCAGDRIRIWPEDCIDGMRRHVPDGSVDLVISDPPYGIDGGTLDKHYARDEDNVVAGYIDVPKSGYAEFSARWIAECARVLRPGGSLYIISGYTGLRDILNALAATGLVEVNHLVWKFNFPVFTTRKWVSTHYHILYWTRPPKRDQKVVFNTLARFTEPAESYHDRMDVIDISRDYKPGERKNKNQLPEALIERLLFYSSNRGDVVLDPFLGGFTTARVALRYGRRAWGFELNRAAYDAFRPEMDDIAEEPDPAPSEPSPEELAYRLNMRARRNEKRAAARAAAEHGR
jgi:site-specific DNA-methyltransferase (adenine-specific)